MSEDGRVRWSTARRLEFIEFRLLWEGRVNRSDIAETFGLTVQQASADLGLYEQIAPNNIAYDRAAKTFVAAPTFRPSQVRDYADRYLLQLAAIENGWIEKSDTWFDEMPSAGVVPIPPRRVPTALIQWLLRAIREKRELDIEYQSMTKSRPTIQAIAPHAFGFDGIRWHVRAWCKEHNDFRDFVLSRIHRAMELRRASVESRLDFEWHQRIQLIVTPNPELPQPVRRAIAREYQMSGGRLKVEARVALAFYFIRQFNFDLEGLPAERRQIVLLNRDDFEIARRKALVQTRAALEAATASSATASRTERRESNGDMRHTAARRLAVPLGGGADIRP